MWFSEIEWEQWGRCQYAGSWVDADATHMLTYVSKVGPRAIDAASNVALLGCHTALERIGL